MRFDQLLWKCLAPGKYESSESNITAALDPQPGETVLLFEIDGPAFRAGQPGVKVCDLLFFYRGPAAPKPVLLFVELKGSDYETAEAQVVNAIRRVVAELSRDCAGADPARASQDLRLVRESASVTIRAVVLLGVALPFNRKQRLKDLFQQTGIVFRYHSETRFKRTDVRVDLA